MASGDDKLARTVNGGLINISAPQMRKYRLELAGNNQAPSGSMVCGSAWW